MLMREYQGKAIFAAAGLNIPKSLLVLPEDVSNAGGLQLPFGFPVAVKAQVRSGGRGKSGGVVRCNNVSAAQATLCTVFDTEFDRERPKAVLIEEWLEAERELYLAVTIDGRADGYCLLYAPRGGIEIENGPPPIRYPFGLANRFRTHVFRALLTTVEEDTKVLERVLPVAERLVRIASTLDCKTVEINPLAMLADGTLIAMDAKIERDEWAAYRQADVAQAIAAETMTELPAVQQCLAVGHMYVRLDGDIGLISGGAGMTMAAMDMIAQYGGRAACFLDCSPGPISAKGFAPAFEMLDADLNVKAILVSVFGGGTQMQYVADAMRAILSAKKMSKPLVFRLDGTNVTKANTILSEMGVLNAASLEEAVASVVKLARENQ